MTFVLFVLGFVILIRGAEWLIEGSTTLARRFGISDLLIGLTVVAFGTSLPELVVNLFAGPESPDLAIGNVVGSNIANVGMVLAVYLMIRPCDVTHEMKWHNMPLLFFVYLLTFLVMLGGKISLMEGIFLFIILILYIFFQYYFPPPLTALEEEIKIHNEQQKKRPRKITLQVFALIASAILLLLGTQALLDGSLKLAKYFGLSERVIAISIIAFGTSLPELATAIVAAFRKEQEILVGTVIGSNIFNPLLIIPCATFVKPIIFSSKMLLIDFPLMVAFTILLWILMVLGHNRLSRIDGAILLFAYFSYITFLYV